MALVPDRCPVVPNFVVKEELAAAFLKAGPINTRSESQPTKRASPTRSRSCSPSSTSSQKRRVADPAAVATQLQVLYDGAVSTSHLAPGAPPVEVARDLAARLLESVARTLRQERPPTSAR